MLVTFFYAGFDFLCYTVSINDRKKKEKPYGKSDDRKRYSENKRRMKPYLSIQSHPFLINFNSYEFRLGYRLLYFQLLLQ